MKYKALLYLKVIQFSSGKTQKNVAKKDRIERKGAKDDDCRHIDQCLME
jgi:hypothetical protein